jgi:radical SAM superfamily enzyme YgiQ (UPF0313 family)
MLSSSYHFFTLLIPLVREISPECVIICGGIHATSTADFLIQAHKEIDYVICGEAEEAIIQWLENISSGKNINIKGVHSRGNIKISNDKLETTEPVSDINIRFENYRKSVDLDAYINRTSLFSLSTTLITQKSFAVMASRGCPGHCVFCSAHTVHGRKPRWRDIENIKDEILHLINDYGVNKIYLMDDNFLPKTKAIELFNLLGDIKKTYSEFEVLIQNMSVNGTDFDIIDAIANAGIKYIPFAIESGSRDIQTRIKKYCDLNKAVELVRYAKDKGIEVRCFYIIGFPNETIAQMRETIDYALRLRANWSSFNVAVPLPGSEMYNEFLSMGCIHNSPDYWKTATIRNRIFDTPEISAEKITKIAYEANLKTNFIHNTDIEDGRYDEAQIIFDNFIKTFPFHIFAWDALRRIYKAKNQTQNAQNLVSTIQDLINTDIRSKALLEYAYLFDDEMRAECGIT